MGNDEKIHRAETLSEREGEREREREREKEIPKEREREREEGEEAWERKKMKGQIQISPASMWQRM